jgi:hypothetical protein
MIGLGLLLALQQAGTDTLCGTPALCRLVAEAARANVAPGRLATYTSRVELEASVISVKDEVVDGPTAVQQVATDVHWERNGPFMQRAVGARSRFSAVPISGMRYLLIGWIVPLTYGDRFPVFGKQGGADLTQAMPSDIDPEFIYAVHPLASDRARYYRYLRADTVEVLFPDSVTRKVIRIRVTPSRIPADRHLLVDGEIDLDVATLQTTAIRARLLATGEPYKVNGVLGSLRIPESYFMEVVNTPDSGGTWIPARQRFEWQGHAQGVEGAAPALRITSRFIDRSTTSLEPGAPDTFNDRPRFLLRSSPRDSVRKFKGWTEPLGEETVRFRASDFFGLDPYRPVLTGKSRFVFLQPGYREDVVRFNRVEGIYTGIPVTYIPGDKLRNTFARVNAGVSWWTGSIKYDGGFGWDNGRTRLELLGGRYLSVTNKFRTQFSSYALGALFSRDNWDYVDRYMINARLIERFGRTRGSRLQVEAGWTQDKSLARVLNTDPWVGYLRPNRGIYTGTYFRTLATLDVNPDISSQFVRQGWGFQLQYDGGVGDLNYSRIQGRAVGRKDFSRAYIVGVIQAGTTLGDSIPPQQLFEVGGAVGLPGYEYKQYAGNKGVLGRVRLTIPIPLFTLGGPLNRALSIPTSQPSISFGYQGAWTSISNDGAQAAVTALGYSFETGSGQTAVDSVTGSPLPASTASNGWRSSIDVRVGFFGGALAIGVAKPFIKGRGIDVFLSIGGQF